MDTAKSKESLKAAGKKRLEEFRLKRQQGGPVKNAAQDDRSDAPVTDDLSALAQSSQQADCGADQKAVPALFARSDSLSHENKALDQQSSSNEAALDKPESDQSNPEEQNQAQEMAICELERLIERSPESADVPDLDSTSTSDRLATAVEKIKVIVQIKDRKRVGFENLVEELQAENVGSSKELTVLKIEVDQLKQRIEEAGAENKIIVELSERKLCDRDEEIGRLKGENANLSEELQGTKTARLVELKVLQTASEDLRKQLERATCELEQATRERVVLQSRVEASDAVIQKQEDELKLVQGNLEKQLKVDRQEFEKRLQERLHGLTEGALGLLEGLLGSGQEKMLKHLDGFAASNEQAERRLTDFQISVDALEKEVLTMDEQVASSLSKAEQSMKKLVSELESAVAAGNLERQTAAITIAELEAKLGHEEHCTREANMRQEQLKLELDAANGKLECYQKELANLEATVGNMSSRQKTLEVDLQEANNCLQKADEVIGATCIGSEVQAFDLEGKIDFFAKEFSRLQRKASVSETEMESLTAKLRDIELLNAELCVAKRERDDSERQRMEEKICQECINLRDSALLMDTRLKDQVVKLEGLWSEISGEGGFAERDVYSRLEFSVDAFSSWLRSNLQQARELESKVNRFETELACKTAEVDMLTKNWDAKLSEEQEKLKAELVTASNDHRAELDAARADRELEVKDLENRLVAVREKLGLAIKKGKGLAQQRDELRQQLAQKSTEMDSLRMKLEAENIRAQKLAAGKDEQVHRLNSLIGAKQEELDACNALLRDSSIKEKSLAAELAMEKQKLAAVLEEKQLLQDYKREACSQLQDFVEQIELQRAELETHLEAESRLKRSLHDLKEQSDRFQEELLSGFGVLMAELSQSYEKKMAAFADVDAVLLRFNKMDAQLVQELKPSPWKEMHDQQLNPGKVMECIRVRLELQLAAILEKSSNTKTILNEALATVEANDQELLACKSQLASKERELESLSHDMEEKDMLIVRVEELEDLLDRNDSTMGSMEMSRNKAVGKLTFTLGKLHELQQQCEAMLAEIESLQISLDNCHMEISGLNQKVETLQTDLEGKNDSLSQLQTRLKHITAKVASGQNLEGNPVDVLEAEIQRLQLENKFLGSTSQQKDAEIQNLRKQVDQTAAEKLRLVKPDNETEIEEMEQPKHMTAASSSAPHFRSQKKTMLLGDQVVMDLEAQIEEKGNAFKSLGMLRFVPKSGHHISDRIDALCVSAGRVLMRQPVTRLFLIVYWIAVHVWIAATITVAKV